MVLNKTQYTVGFAKPYNIWSIRDRFTNKNTVYVELKKCRTQEKFVNHLLQKSPQNLKLNHNFRSLNTY